MKGLKIGVTLFFLMVIVTFSNAQSNGDKLDKMITELSLNAKQTEEVRALYGKYKPLIKEAESVEEKKKYRSEIDLGLQGILTKEQYGKYKEHKSKSRANVRPRVQ